MLDITSIIGGNGGADVEVQECEVGARGELAERPETEHAAAMRGKPGLSRGERRALVAQAGRGDHIALSRVTRALDAEPVMAQEVVELAHLAHAAMVRAVSGGDRELEEALPRRTAQLGEELAGEGASALDRLLCERVASCWLGVYLLDAATSTTKAGKPAPREWVEHYERMRDRAHRRYLEACVALARVRRLLAPVVQQVNIAQAGARQLNVAGGRAVQDAGEYVSADLRVNAADGGPGLPEAT